MNGGREKDGLTTGGSDLGTRRRRQGGDLGARTQGLKDGR
jgi:hypothetical protein